jgi:hypothetical protein
MTARGFVGSVTALTPRFIALGYRSGLVDRSSSNQGCATIRNTTSSR